MVVAALTDAGSTTSVTLATNVLWLQDGSTFGSADRIRVPCPAAMISAVKGVMRGGRVVEGRRPESYATLIVAKTEQAKEEQVGQCYARPACDDAGMRRFAGVRRRRT